MNENKAPIRTTESDAEFLLEDIGLFSTLVDQLPHKVFLKDVNSTYISCNSAYAHDLGISPKEIAGKTDCDFYSRELAEKYRRDDLRIIESGLAEEIEESYQLNGTVYTVQTSKSPIKSSNGQVLGVLGIFHDITEKKRILDELSATDLRFRSLLSYTTDAVFCYEYDPPIDTALPEEEQISKFYQGFLVECNQKAAAAFQAETPDDVIGKNILEIFHAEPNSLDEFYRLFIKKDYRIVGMESEEIQENGSSYRYKHNAYGVIEDGKLKRVWGTYLDITDRARQDRLIHIQRDLGLALLSSGSLDETLALCLESAIQISNVDSGGIFLFNDNGAMELAKTTGLPEEFIHASKIFEPETPYVQMILKGEPIFKKHENLGIDIDGPRKEEGLKGVGIIPIAFEGEIIACLNVGSHVLDEIPHHTRESLGIIANQIGLAIAHSKTQAELTKYRENLEELVEERSKELYNSEARLRAFVSAVPDLIFIIDENGKYVDVFTADQTLLYRELAAIKDHTLAEIFPAEIADKFLTIIKQTINSGQSQKFEYPLEVQGGMKWFESQTALINPQNPEDKSPLVVWVARDITERVDAKKTLELTSQKLARSNEELEQFAYIASHDLQEPLRKITTFSNRLQTKFATEINRQALDYLVRMQSAADRGQQLISDLLEFSRVTSQGKPFKEVDLNQVLKDAQTALDIKLEETKGEIVSDTLPVIRADYTQMLQLFQNLIGNSLKYRQEGILPKVTISHNNSNLDFTEIVVQDNGIGFDMEYHERIFQPFQRLHGKSEIDGSGIGLSICRKIVERHGGTLNAASEPGRGARFTITIPVIRQETEKTSQQLGILQ